MPSAADVGASASGHTHGPSGITGATANALLRTNGSGVGEAIAPAADVVALLDAATHGDMRVALAVQDGPRLIPLVAAASSSSATPSVEGYGRFTPADYAITGRTTTLTLSCVGLVSGAGLTGTLELLDCADDSVVGTITWTETVPTHKTTAITLPGSAKTYKARVSCTGVTDPLTEYALLGGANLRITWS